MPELSTLIADVRRQRQRQQLATAARRALWATSAWLLLAVAVHLLWQPVAIGWVAATLALGWMVMLVRAAWQRPTDAECALWADRHLGGASAFGTLLELRRGGSVAADADALRWLEAWAGARVAPARQQLARSSEPLGLHRAAASASVGVALAAVVLNLPGRAQVPKPPTLASPASLADPVAPAAQVLASTPLAGDIAAALRSAAADAAAHRRGSAAAVTEGATRPGSAAEPSSSPGLVQASRPGAADNSATPRAADSTTAAGAGAGVASTSAGGRDAGDARAAQADVSAPPTARGTIPGQRLELQMRGRSVEPRSDRNRTTHFDDGEGTPGLAAGRDDRLAAAARPPPAVDALQLTATETSYVQAWMKARQQGL